MAKKKTKRVASLCNHHTAGQAAYSYECHPAWQMHRRGRLGKEAEISTEEVIVSLSLSQTHTHTLALC